MLVVLTDKLYLYLVSKDYQVQLLHSVLDVQYDQFYQIPILTDFFVVVCCW